MIPTRARIATAAPMAISQTRWVLSAWIARNVIAWTGLASGKFSAQPWGKINRERREHKNHDQRRNSQESSQGEMVLAGNPPAEPIHRAKSSPAGPLRDFQHRAARIHESDDHDSDNASEQSPQQNHEERISYSQ